MKKTVFVGLFFICFSLVYPFAVQGGLLQIDIIPTCLGFVLATLGLDNLPYANRRLKELQGFSTGCAVISFLTLLGQLTPFYNLILFSSTGETNNIFKTVLSYLRLLWQSFENGFMCVYMIFVAFLCYCFFTELSKRISASDASFTGKKLNAYGEITFSRSYIKHTAFFAKFFSVVYALVAALYAVNQIYAFISGGKGFYIAFYDFEFGLWAFLIPVHIVFLIFADAAVNICRQPRQTTLTTSGGK